jgi:hypothetical protein
MLVGEVNNMRNFVVWAIMTSFEKTIYNVCFSTQFSQLSKIKKLVLIKLLATRLSPLKSTFLNSMLALLAI